MARSRPNLIEHFDPQTLSLLSSLDLKARYIVEGFLYGLHQSPFHGLSVEFSEYRDYQPGDDLRHLDWRLYARTDRYFVKQYEADTNTNFTILMDLFNDLLINSSDFHNIMITQTLPLKSLKLIGSIIY